MGKKNLLIVPSRKRHKKIIDFYNCFKQNSSITDLCIGLDTDDYHNYPIFDDVIYEINPNMNLGPKLNLIANKYAGEYEYVSFMGDDHWIRTENWDQTLIQSIYNIPNGICYGDDLFQGSALPTAVLMNSNIIKKLGYMCPPNQKHLYLDDFWKDLGENLGTLKYVPSVVIEHMHFQINKSASDEIYERVNSQEMYAHDKIAYDNYKYKQFEKDLKKLQ